MRRNQEWLPRPTVSLVAVLTLSAALFGQTSDNSDSLPIPSDFSHRHVIFSKPSTTEQAATVEQDVRYWQQLYRRQLAMSVRHAQVPATRNRKLKRDWAQSLGSGASVGAGNYPAKFSFSSSVANCGNALHPDFAVYNTGLASATQASVVAYDNLYSGCTTGTVPSVYWAYNTGGKILTSVALSFDGKQIAFVQTSSGQASLVLLKWAASTTQTVGNPGIPIPVLPALYSACIAPCMTSIALTDSGGTPHDDTTSSVFYVYSNDTAYVGDSAGWLHQFSGLFKGNPLELRTGGWPVHVNPLTSKALTVAVHDVGSGNTFVGDAGGFLYRVSSAAGVTASGQLDHGVGIVQGPIIDPTIGVVYVFASSDGSGGCIGGTNCSSVYVLSFNFMAGGTGAKTSVGASTLTGTTPNPLYIGDFDSLYQNSVNATGNLYVCGNTGGPPVLYRVAIAGGVLGTVTAGPVLSTSTTPCSPVTDVVNPNISGGTTEWAFASADTHGIATGCAAGCIYNFKNTPWQASASYAVGQEILDTNFEIQMVTTAGTSGSTAPVWSSFGGTTTSDGTVTWLSLGATTTTTPGTWTKLTHFLVGTTILDPNGNLELVTTSHGNGNSGGSTPTWSMTAGGATTDAALIWTNMSAPANFALPSAGGASGTVIDNTVQTLAGASQIYFSTLSNQATCGSSSSVGCAVQASQAALK